MSYFLLIHCKLSEEFMATLISKDLSIVDDLASALVESEGIYLNRDYKAIAEEYLTQERAIEQIELFENEVNKVKDYDFKGKKFLEIGSGVGTLLVTARTKYGIDAYGIEPSEEEFTPFNEISSMLFKEFNILGNILVKGKAEKLPFEDESFDLVYSTNVLEHVENPEKVLNESLRVLKKGGFLQFVIPNYFSFWEGHYGIFWPCITSKTLGKVYVKFLGLKPDYVNTLNLISPFYLQKVLKQSPYKYEVIGWGNDIFKKRLGSGNYSDWASLKNLRLIVNLVQKFKIASLIASILNLFGMYTPIVLTLRKN